MKICYIADARSIHTQRWVKYFADRGHQVYLISPRAFGENNIENVHLYTLNKFRPQIRIVSATINLLRNVLQVRRLLKRLKPDILHAHYVAINRGFLGALSGFHPFILTAWGSDVLVAPKKSKGNNFIVKFALRKANLVLTTSQYLKGYLHREFKLPEYGIRAIPWGNDLRIFHKGYEAEVKTLKINLGIDNNHFVILSPRGLKKHYRIECIVQAMPYIMRKYRNVILVILEGAAKDSKYESEIDNLARKLRVAENIRVIHREVRPQEMAALDNASNVLISIPKSDQFAACIQEGMACGVIPIVGNLEIYNQYLANGENAFFVNPENPKEIGQKIIYCIEHPELKERFYEINRRIIEEKEDWAKNAPRMEELYLELIQKSRRI